MAYRLGFEVGRYISIERLIEQHKERYYETLEQSSAGWHEGGNNQWPYASFVQSTLKNAYGELEERLGQVTSPRGSKSALVQAAVQAKTGHFTLAALERQCPGVSRDLIRRVLGDLREKGLIESVGRGPGAEWRKKS